MGSGKTTDALKMVISLNPILHSFCTTQRKNIPQRLVDAFLHSMRMVWAISKDLDDRKIQ